jgi:hypothetical protein
MSVECRIAIKDSKSEARNSKQIRMYKREIELNKKFYRFGF